MLLALATGRLEQPGWDWLNAHGLAVGRRSGRRLLWTAQPSLEVALVRGRDIPALLERQAVDVAIVGRDVVEDSGIELSLTQSLGFGECRLVFATPQTWAPDPSRALRIATRYGELTRRWAAAKGLQVEIVSLGGSVEVAPALGLADAVVDIVETGTTLRSNGLVEREVVLSSYAGLATRTGEEYRALALSSGAAVSGVGRAGGA